MDYVDYAGLGAAGNKTGINKTFWFAPKSWFDSIKESTTNTNPGDTVTITTAHTFDTGKGWVECNFTDDTAEILAETIGDNVDSQSLAPVLNGFLGGLTPENTEIVQALIQGEEVLILVQDCNLSSGTYIQLGCKCSGMYVKAKLSTGKRSGGVKGWELEFKGYCNINFYTSTLTLKP